MALVDCYECGKQISDKSEHCIHCGAPISLSKATTPEITIQPSVPEDVSTALNLPEATDIVRQEGIIQKILTGHKNSKSIAEIIIQMPNGSIISTGEQEAKEIKPFLWSINEQVSYRKIDGNAVDLKKVKSVGVSSDRSNDSNSPSPSPSKISERNGNNERVTKNYLWYLMLLTIFAGYWIAKGTPNPVLFFSGSIAKQECLHLANKNKDSFIMFNNNEITANNSWLKDGKRVVQLLQKDDDKGINQIMCVYGNGMVQIPSLLEQARWH